MTVTLETAQKATDLGDYASELDRTLAAPSERIAFGSEPGEPGPVADALDPTAVLPLVAIIGSIATSRTGTADLTERERAQVADALAPVLDKYAGDLFDSYAEEVALAAVLYIVAAPRITEYRAEREEPDAALVEESEALQGAAG